MEIPYSNDACYKDEKRFVVLQFSARLFENVVDRSQINYELNALQIRRLLVQNFTKYPKVHKTMEPITEEIINGSLTDAGFQNSDAQVYAILDRKQGKLVSCLFIKSILPNEKRFVADQKLMDYEGLVPYLIYNVCTDKDYQRSGCCKRLFDFVTNKTVYGRNPMILDVSVATRKVENERGFNPAAYCYEKYGFRFASSSPLHKNPDGYSKIMVRPKNGVYSWFLFNNTKSVHDEERGGEDPRRLIMDIQGQIVSLLILENKTKTIKPGAPGSTLTGLYTNQDTGVTSMQTIIYA